MAAPVKQTAARPLSPHLQIYRFTLLMASSILHRVTGGALYAGTVLVAWWLIALASGPQAYATFQAVAGSWFGLLVLFGYTWVLFQHMMGGIRHLIWDTGASMEVAAAKRLAVGSYAASTIATLVVWIVAFLVR